MGAWTRVPRGEEDPRGPGVGACGLMSLQSRVEDLGLGVEDPRILEVLGREPTRLRGGSWSRCGRSSDPNGPGVGACGLMSLRGRLEDLGPGVEDPQTLEVLGWEPAG